jgi:CubicO group peptidase (beta-lactamase class C family)
MTILVVVQDGAWGNGSMRKLLDAMDCSWTYLRLIAGPCCLAGLLLLLCTPARPLDDTAAIPDALDRTFKEWMSKSGVQAASLAVMKDSMIVKSFR